ncbi:MAG: lysophospholipid acyltransferase family protein [Actinomycetota bacterium]
MYAVARALLLPFLKLFFRWRLLGAQNIPKSGPVIVACNHISYFDPLCHAYMIDRAGRKCRFFAKSELWQNPFLRFVLTHAHQIPVERGSGETGPVEKAIEWLGRDELVVIYPEATITTNLDLTPMQGKTGVGRVALATGARVVPVAVWGSHWVRPKRRKPVRRFRRLITLKAGEPIRFDDLKGGDAVEAAREATDRVIGELDRLVRELHKIYPEGAAVPELITEDG